jgi:predicted Zn-dependent protease
MANNRDMAVRFLKACRGDGGDTDRIALESQLVEASAGELESSEKTLRQHLDDGHPERRAILEALVRGFIGRGRAEDAERFATLWVDDAPSNWKPYFHRGAARLLLSRDLLSTAHDNAKSDFLRVVELKPDHDAARLLLGNAYAMSGQFKEALPHLEHYTRLKPEDPAGAAELARCHRTLGSPEEARRLLDDWLAAHRGTADVFLVRGEAAQDLGKPKESLDFLLQARTLAPANEKIDFALAAAYRALGRAQEAAVHEEKWQTRKKLRERLKDLESTATREPKNVAARHEAGTIALQLDDEPAAMRWFGAVLTIDPAHRPTHEFLANHFEKKGRHDAAAFHRRHAQQPPK